MAAENIIKLFDFFWFEHPIFPLKKTSPHLNPTTKLKESNPCVESQNDKSLSCNISPESNMELKLQTVFSGEEFEELTKIVAKKEDSEAGEKQRRKKGGKKNKSLSELEFEELKGFLDMGFVFTKEDNKNQNLVSIIPALQRGRKHGENIGVLRPYLSESWHGFNNPFMDLRNEVNMKDHLKQWAHSVASAVK